MDDGLSLSFLLIVVPAFAIGKILVWLGVVNHDNYFRASALASGTLGIVVAISFTPVSHIPYVPDYLGQIIVGIFVAAAAFLCIAIGFGLALPHDK